MSFRQLQNEAREDAERYLATARSSIDAKEAADWAHAAKAAIAVAVSCETVLKIQRTSK